MLYYLTIIWVLLTSNFGQDFSTFSHEKCKQWTQRRKNKADKCVLRVAPKPCCTVLFPENIYFTPMNVLHNIQTQSCTGFPSKNWITILSKNSAYQPWSLKSGLKQVLYYNGFLCFDLILKNFNLYLFKQNWQFKFNLWIISQWIMNTYFLVRAIYKVKINENDWYLFRD